MQKLNNLCAFCGSKNGLSPVFKEESYRLGKRMAENNIRLIYGAGHSGLMGAVANGALDHGGKVTGIIPNFLYNNNDLKEFSNKLDELSIVETMHERKMLMFEKADAFVALPGGIGTLDELVEQLTWAQLRQHKKPVLLADFDGYWAPFLDLLDHMKAHAFTYNEPAIEIIRAKSADEIVPKLKEALSTIDATGNAAG